MNTRTLVIIPTFNEASNLPLLVAAIFQHAPDVNLLVVDDNSPDGTRAPDMVLIATPLSAGWPACLWLVGLDR